MQGDIDAVRCLHQGTVHPLSNVASTTLATLLDPAGCHDVEAVAVRGETLALCVGCVGAKPPRPAGYVLGELAEDGHLAFQARFDPEQLDEAFDLLDERWWPTIDPEAATMLAVGARLTTAMNERDPEGLRACFTEDALVVDNRPLSGVRIDRDQFVGAFEMMREASSDVRFRNKAVLAYAPPVAIQLNEEYGTRDGGAFANDYFVVSKVRGDRRELIELFAEADETPPGPATTSSPASDLGGHAASSFHASVRAWRMMLVDDLELLGPGDEWRGELDDRVAAVVGPAVQAELEQALATGACG